MGGGGFDLSSIRLVALFLLRLAEGRYSFASVNEGGTIQCHRPVVQVAHYQDSGQCGASCSDPPDLCFADEAQGGQKAVCRRKLTSDKVWEIYDRCSQRDPCRLNGLAIPSSLNVTYFCLDGYTAVLDPCEKDVFTGSSVSFLYGYRRHVAPRSKASCTCDVWRSDGRVGDFNIQGVNVYNPGTGIHPTVTLLGLSDKTRVQASFPSTFVAKRVTGVRLAITVADASRVGRIWAEVSLQDGGRLSVTCVSADDTVNNGTDGEFPVLYIVVAVCLLIALTATVFGLTERFKSSQRSAARAAADDVNRIPTDPRGANSSPHVNSYIDVMGMSLTTGPVHQGQETPASTLRYILDVPSSLNKEELDLNVLGNSVSTTIDDWPYTEIDEPPPCLPPSRKASEMFDVSRMTSLNMTDGKQALSVTAASSFTLEDPCPAALATRVLGRPLSRSLDDFYAEDPPPCLQTSRKQSGIFDVVSRRPTPDLCRQKQQPSSSKSSYVQELQRVLDEVGQVLTCPENSRKKSVTLPRNPEGDLPLCSAPAVRASTVCHRVAKDRSRSLGRKSHRRPVSGKESSIQQETCPQRKTRSQICADFSRSKSICIGKSFETNEVVPLVARSRKETARSEFLPRSQSPSIQNSHVYQNHPIQTITSGQEKPGTEVLDTTATTIPDVSPDTSSDDNYYTEVREPVPCCVSSQQAAASPDVDVGTQSRGVEEHKYVNVPSAAATSGLTRNHNCTYPSSRSDTLRMFTSPEHGVDEFTTENTDENNETRTYLTMCGHSLRRDASANDSPARTSRCPARTSRRATTARPV